MSSSLRYGAALLLLLALFSLPWLDSGRTPAPPPAPSRQVSLLAIGDVTFGRYVGAEIAKRGDFDFPLAGIAARLRETDLTLANLEGPLVAQPPPYIPANQVEADKLALIGDSRAAAALARAGLKVAGLANNHILDAGPAGVLSTIAALQAAGVLVVGAGTDEAAARRAVTLEIHGLRVAVLARSAIRSNYLIANGGPLYPGPAYIDPNSAADLQKLAAAIAQARQSADAVVLLMHWGTEYTGSVNAAQQALAAMAAQAGADLVIGAHPHVAQPFALLPGPAGGGRGTLVAYSLGNALFDQFFSPEVRQGLAFAATLGAAGAQEARLLPLPRASYGPTLPDLADPTTNAAIARVYSASSPELRGLVLSQPIRDGGSEIYELLPALLYRAPEPPSTSTAADLIGDGTAEQVSLRGGQVEARRSVGRTSDVLWASPLNWRVDRLRVAQADELAANGLELAFTVWKPSLATEFIPPALRGRIGQHFFLFGQRDGGIYPVWNSSILPDPIIDFDFVPGPAVRLVTLEGSYDDAAGAAARAVAVWAWTGFGYALEWRSPAPLPGAFQHTQWRGALYISQ